MSVNRWGNVTDPTHLCAQPPVELHDEKTRDNVGQDTYRKIVKSTQREHPSRDTTKSVHHPEPDYQRQALEIPEEAREKMFSRLCRLYAEPKAREVMPELERILKVYHAHKPRRLIEADKSFRPAERFTESDVILITYGDLLKSRHHAPLASLELFCDSYLEGTINTLHILPFFPYSSDRGFSIIDFETVDPNLGTWDDIEKIEKNYQLMFDGVINHVSSRSRWFREFLNCSRYYRDFFIIFESPEELTADQRGKIFRPRTTDVLTEFSTLEGPKYVWTTFSEDQIDLNYKNPDVLMRVIELLLLYVRHGADIIRLDAVTFLWAEPGTSCVHLEETHEIVKLFRDILNTVAPRVALITETNVPHKDNISYFGDGNDEAQMVYNFALPPLVLYTFYKEDATALTTWAQDLVAPSDVTTFFNFLDSHDGIGLMGVKDVLPRREIDFMIERAKQNGGCVSYKTGEDGTDSPYEINITWFSALNREDGDEDIAFQVKRFVASRIVALVLAGVPGIYLHSLIGTRNDIEAVLATDSKRDINRALIDYEAILSALEDPLSKISRINREFGRLISIRTQQRPFHPNGGQRILQWSPQVFSVLRTSPEGDQHILTLTNISNSTCRLEVPTETLGFEQTHWSDLVSHMEWMTDEGKLFVNLQPYDVLWLQPTNELTPESST